jgi:rSAM/selenodomain-associated transferase 2
MISIIVPVLNEEKQIEAFLKKLVELKGKKEIILVDGGSLDNTVKIASKYCSVAAGPKGRGAQMNYGASLASGNIFWFLHCDARVNNNALSEIEKCIKDGYTWGGFSLFFCDDETLFMKYVAYSSNIRGKHLKIVYGDQGVFIKREGFLQIGGYPEIALMEEWVFSKKAAKAGRMKLLDMRLGTSARRFHNGGPIKTLLLMQKIRLLYLLGVSPDKLEAIYRRTT